MEKIVFADTFTKTFKNVMKIPSVTIDDPIFRLHYRFTGLALLFSSIMVSAYQFFGDPIMCIQRDNIPESLLNTYCWVEGTFTLPKALSKKIGTEIVYPGVDSHNEGDEIIEHAFYQWVCFVLFLQALMFCFPHVIWHTWEAGRMKSFIQELGNPLLFDCDKTPCFSRLACYFKDRKNQHNHYVQKFIFCEVLNFVNVVGQMYFIDKFLGGEFTTYGADVIKYVNSDQQNRTDPMIRVFPRVTKCTFHKFGSSGSVQKHDALCLLPLNILNEKIFVVMWFWFVILATLDGALLIYRFITLCRKDAQFKLLRFASSLTPKDQLENLIISYSYGDFFLLYLLADNIDSVHFSNFVEQLQKCPPENDDSAEKGEIVHPKGSSISSTSKKDNLDDVDGGQDETSVLLSKDEHSV